MQNIISLTNKHIVISTPLILFSLISTVYMAVSLSSGKVTILLFSAFLFSLMLIAFAAGWFNMIKKAVCENDTEHTGSLMPEFFSGVAEYMLPVAGAFFNLLIFLILGGILVYFLGITTIGNPGIDIKALTDTMSNPAALKSFLSGLSTEQLIKINIWNMLILSSVGILYFIFMLYMPAIFFSSRNPFKAFYISLKNLFSRRFFKSLGIYFLIIIANSVISVLTVIFQGNIILHFLITLLNFYFMTAVGIGLFYYYRKYFTDFSIGQNIDIKI